MGHEEDVGGVLEGLGEAVDVAAVPGGFLGEQDLDDVEFGSGGGVQVGGGVLRSVWGALGAGRWDCEDDEECEDDGEGLEAEFRRASDKSSVIANVTKMMVMPMRRREDVTEYVSSGSVGAVGCGRERWGRSRRELRVR